MTTEFAKLNNSIITPLMKSKGYKKIGKYDYGSTFDQAVYETSNRSLKVIFSVHPYDYPYHGITVEACSDGKVVLEKHYSLDAGNLEYLIELLAKDIKEGEIST